MKLGVCRRLGILPLSRVVVEELESGFDAQKIESSPQVDRLLEIIRSAQFSEGIVRVLRHQQHAHQEQIAIDGPFVQSRIDEFEFEFVDSDSLRTRFILEFPKRRDITAVPEGSLVFVDHHKKTVIVAANALGGQGQSQSSGRSGVEVEFLLANVLARQIVNIEALEDLLPIVAMMKSGSVDDLQLVLDHLHIRTTDQQNAERGVAGELLIESDLALVQLKPLRNFVVGEVVAWRDANGELRYGVVTRGRESEDSLSGSILVQLTAGTEAVSMMTTEVLSFKSVSSHSTDAADDGESSSSSSGAGGGGTGEGEDEISEANLQRLREQFGTEFEVVNGGADGSGDGDGMLGSSSGGHDVIPEHLRNRGTDSLSEKDVVNAIVELMARVNIPLSADMRELMGKKMKLEQEASEMTRRATEAEKRLMELEGKTEQVEEVCTCPICLTNVVNRVINPCGHTVCGECLGSIRGQACPFCRQRMEGSVGFLLARNLMEE
eukprot:TRINITY_DN947_c0_g1_i1.p1 TRINITY_DN947_c0_g1~~TRINITY_DN947_c0_g1_i1.p1  ORF type:complete len:493 (-),score=157.03 TRINITY_DN947_c0_g1_i1:212-1690(-)